MLEHVEENFIFFFLKKWFLEKAVKNKDFAYSHGSLVLLYFEYGSFTKILLLLSNDSKGF